MTIIQLRENSRFDPLLRTFPDSNKLEKLDRINATVSEKPFQSHPEADPRVGRVFQRKK
jgi:hypothetical protein